MAAGGRGTPARDAACGVKRDLCLCFRLPAVSSSSRRDKIEKSDGTSDMQPTNLIIVGLSRLRLCLGKQSLSIRFFYFIPTGTRHTLRHPKTQAEIPLDTTGGIPGRLRSSVRKIPNFRGISYGRGGWSRAREQMLLSSNLSVFPSQQCP